MSDMAVSTIVLAAGFGSRMKSARAKVLHEIGGRSMLGHVLETASALRPASMAVIIGDHAPETGDHACAFNDKINVYVQSPPRGTGDAVRQAMAMLENFDGAALVLFADTPLITGKTLSLLKAEIEDNAAVAVLGFTPPDPGQYGRLKKDAAGDLAAIIEYADASDEERAIALCNSGVMAFDAAFLRENIGALKNDNAKGEYYLTDLVAIARRQDKRCAIVSADADEVVGVNSREDLAAAERIFQQRMRKKAMTNGVTLFDPDTVYFAHDTSIGKDVTIGQNVVFGPGVEIGDEVVIHANCHIEGAKISRGASIGPFARLRPGAEIGERARIGNFVEVKKAIVAAGAKINHLSYVGDASVGEGANIGAGVITCNYDGFSKHRTEIGDGAFVGSNSALVAPVRIGDGAYIGSGSVITKEVEPGDLAVARGRQSAIKGWAARFRAAHEKKKNS